MGLFTHLLTLALGLAFAEALSMQARFRSSLSGASSMRMDYAVVGVAGGSAETIACRLLAEGKKVTTILDRAPSSPILSKSEGVYVAEDIELDIIPLVAGAGAPTSLQSACVAWDTPRRLRSGTAPTRRT